MNTECVANIRFLLASEDSNGAGISNFKRRNSTIQTETDQPGAHDQAKKIAKRAEVDFYGDPDAGYTRVNILLW